MRSSYIVFISSFQNISKVRSVERASVLPGFRFIWCMLFMIGLLFFSFPYAAQADQETASSVPSPVSEHEAALKFARQGKYDQSLELLRKLYLAGQADKAVHYDYATVLSWAGKYRQSIDVAKKLDDSELPEYCLEAVAAAHRHSGSFAKALALYERGSAAYPNNANLHAGRIMTLADMGRLEEAGNLSADIRRDQPELFAHEAIQGSNAFLEERKQGLRQEEIDAQRAKAVSLAREKRYSEALPILENLYANNPDDVAVFNDYLTVLAWSGRKAALDKLVDKMDPQTTPAYVYESVGSFLRRSGMPNRAMGVYRAAVQKYPDNYELAKGLAFCLADVGETGEALAVLDRFVTVEVASNLGAGKPKDILKARVKALEEARSGNYGNSLSRLLHLHKHYPQNKSIVADYATVLDWFVLSGKTEAGDRARLASMQKQYLRHVRQGAPSRGQASGNRPASASSDSNAARPDSPPVAPPPYHDAQIAAAQKAREGNLEGARKQLEALLQQYPNDPSLLGDYILVLGWAKEDDLVISQLSRMPLATAPHYIVKPVGRAFANLSRFFDAEQFFDALRRAQPHNADLQLEVALLLGDYGQSFRALMMLPLDGPGLKLAIEKARLALGYDKALSLADLSRAHSALARNPADSAAHDLKRAGLYGVGAPYRAWFESLHPATPYTRNASRKAHTDRYIKESEWAEQIPLEEDREERVAQLRRSLVNFDRILQNPAAIASRLDAASTPLQAASSLSVAELASAHGARNVPGLMPAHEGTSLIPGYSEQEAVELAFLQQLKTTNELNMRPETVRAYEAMPSLHSRMPDGPKLAVADAYLGTRHPDKAEALYREVVDAGKQESDVEIAKLGLFWALLEQEKLKEALEHAKQLLEDAPEPNPRSAFKPDMHQKRGASNLLGLAYSYTGFLQEGEEHLEKSLDNAPANQEGWQFLATNRNLRGLPLAALDALALAEVHKDTGYVSIEMEAERFSALMASRQWEAAHEILKRMAEYMPFSPQLQRMQRAWEIHNLWETRLYSNWSSTNRTNPGVSDYNLNQSIEWLLFTPPVHYNWRAFAGALYGEGRFNEGRGYQKKLLGGVEYRSKWLEASLSVGANIVNSTRTAVALGGRVHLDDHWSIPFSIEKDSPHTPLRAENSDVFSNAVSSGFSYYWNESRYFNLDVRLMDFSDDNARLEVGAALTQRLFTYYTHRLDATLETYYSQNSKDDDRFYYNPKMSMEAGGKLKYTDLLWRKYDRSLEHAVSAGVGSYHQKYYGSDVVWHLGYEQSLSLSDRLDFHYGYTMNRRVYDGDSELAHNFFLNMRWRF